MEILPAVDILGGKCVRLLRGDFAKATQYAENPLAQAQAWAEQGARWLHVVDLDGAGGGGDNAAHIEAILAGLPQLRVQVGGGIRDLAAVRRWLGAGAARVVLGTAAVQSPDFLRAACEEAPGQVVLGLDYLGERVQIKGWTEQGPPLREMLDRVRELPLAALLCTDIGQDGTLAGAAVEATAQLGRSQPHPVLLSGGVGSLDDLRAAAATGAIAGAVCGKALYERRFSLAEALRAAAGEAGP